MTSGDVQGTDRRKYLRVQKVAGVPSREASAPDKVSPVWGVARVAVPRTGAAINCRGFGRHHCCGRGLVRCSSSDDGAMTGCEDFEEWDAQRRHSPT